MSQLFAWGGQSVGVSASASFPPKKSQGCSPSEWTGWISLQSKELSRVFNTTVQKHQMPKGTEYTTEIRLCEKLVKPSLGKRKGQEISLQKLHWDPAARIFHRFLPQFEPTTDCGDQCRWDPPPLTRAPSVSATPSPPAPHDSSPVPLEGIQFPQTHLLPTLLRNWRPFYTNLRFFSLHLASILLSPLFRFFPSLIAKEMLFLFFPKLMSPAYSVTLNWQQSPVALSSDLLWTPFIRLQACGAFTS